MTRKFTNFVCAAMLATCAASTAFSQDNDAAASAETSTEASTTPAAPVDELTALALAADETKTGTHGDWSVACTEGDDRVCTMLQLARNEEGVAVAVVRVNSLASVDNLAAGVTVKTPLNTLLSQKLAVKVDSNDPQVYDFTYCQVDGCVVRYGLTNDGLARYKRGAVAKMRVVSTLQPDRPVILDVSLTGFTAAFNELEER